MADEKKLIPVFVLRQHGNNVPGEIAAFEPDVAKELLKDRPGGPIARELSSDEKKKLEERAKAKAAREDAASKKPEPAKK